MVKFEIDRMSMRMRMRMLLEKKERPSFSLVLLSQAVLIPTPNTGTSKSCFR